MEDKFETLEELRSLLKSDMSDEELCDRLVDYHSADLADLYEELGEDERKRLIEILPEDEVSDLFTYLENPEDYIGEIGNEQAADIIEQMDADDAVDILEELEPDTREEIISLMEDEAVEDIKLISSYPDDAIGSLMTTNFIIVKSGMTIKQAMKALVDQAAENDNVSTVYVENENDEYFGAINLRDLIVAREHDSLEDLVKTSYPSVSADETIEECLEQLKDYSEDSIPVLDEASHVIGVITSEDLVEAADVSFGDDYAKLGGLTSEDDLNEPLGRSLLKRIPWLVVLFVLGLLVSSVIGSFEHVIDELPYIVAFQSLVLDMAGNVGTQSLAVTIRVLTGDDLTGKAKLKVVWKELRVGLSNGCILGLGSFLFVGAYLCINYPPSTAFLTSACIGLALLLAMTLSAFFGSLIPMLFKKIHVDPAVASGPFITTINDLIAAVSYYGLAWLFLIVIF